VNPNIISVNDLVVLDEDEFYATNDHYFGFASKLVRFFETFSLVFNVAAVTRKSMSRVKK